MDCGPVAPLPDGWEPPPIEPARSLHEPPPLLAPDLAAGRNRATLRMHRAVLDAVIATLVGFLIGLLGATVWGPFGVAAFTLGAALYGLARILWAARCYRLDRG
jgi:hypothetical protein